MAGTPSQVVMVSFWKGEVGMLKCEIAMGISHAETARYN